MHQLSVAIITLNEERNIGRCLESVKPVAAEIIVVDSDSTDRTADICLQYGCRVINREFKGYSAQKQFAVDQAVHDWILVMDADEELTPPLQVEIRKLLANQHISHAGFKIPRSLFYLGKILRHSGVRDKPVLRLFDRRKGRFDGKPVHEEIIVEGTTGTLKTSMIHYSYQDLSHHLRKSNIYTTHAAEDNFRKGKKYSKGWVALKFPVTFFSYYILKGGFLDGYPGFMWSFLAAFYGSVKLAKTVELAEANHSSIRDHV